MSLITVLRRASQGDVTNREMQHLHLAARMIDKGLLKKQVEQYTGLPETTLKKMYIGLRGRHSKTGRPTVTHRFLEKAEFCLAGSIHLRYYLSLTGLPNKARLSNESEVDIDAFIRSYEQAKSFTPAVEGFDANLALMIVKEYCHRDIFLEKCHRCSFHYAVHCEKINTSCPLCTVNSSELKVLPTDSSQPH